MNRLHVGVRSLVAVPINILLLANAAFAQSQTPGQITQFDSSLSLVNSVITQDPSGRIGIGTTTPAAALDVATGDLSLAGNVVKDGQLFIHNLGNQNIFVGLGAGNAVMSGDYNSGTGALALSANATGRFNTANGAFALRSNTDGFYNTASGYGALVSNTVGTANTAFGDQALFENVNGYHNTAVGAFALDHNSGGSNTAIGSAAGFNATTGSNNIYLGSYVLGVAGESNTIYLGQQGMQSKTFIAGIRGTTTMNNDAVPVMIDSAGQLGTVSSARRFKEDIQDMSDASRRVLGLRPVTFRYARASADGSKPIQYGLVAEEVAAAFPELAVRGSNGEIETVHYETLSVLLLNELQRQEKGIQEQQQRIDALERQTAENEVLKARIEALERLVKAIQSGGRR